MIKLENVSKFYHNEGNVVLGLHRVNLEFKMGEFVAITGESGSGKSTLLNVISGLDSYEEGELYFNGEETSHYDEEDWQEYRKNNIGFVFQNYHLIDSYTVLENVESVMIINGISKKARRKRALEILKQVGLEKHLKHKGTKLSGGEKQRLAIARAIAKDTPVIVADEPTGNLDTKTGKQIIEILKELSKTKLVIMVTHNHDLIDGEVSRIVRLYDAKVVEDRVISKPEIPNVNVTTSNDDSTFKKAFPFALLNFKNQPKVTILSLLVAMLTTFIVSLMLAVLFEARISNILSSNHYFYNSPRNRIVVNSPHVFSNDEITQLANLDNVDYIIHDDLAYNDYINLTTSSGHNTYYYRGVFRYITEITEDDLISGRLPQNDYEIVITNDNRDGEKLLNHKVNLYSYTYYRADIITLDEYTVVGIAKGEEGIIYNPPIYLTAGGIDYFNRYIFSLLSSLELSINNEDYDYTTMTFIIEDTIPSGQIGIEHRNFERFIDNDYQAGDTLNIKIREQEFSYTLHEYKQTEDDEHYDLIIFRINSDDFNTLTNHSRRQLSVYVKNHNLANQTIEQIEKLGYVAFNPVNHTRGNDLYTTLANVWITIIFSGLILVIYFIASLIINAIFTNKLRDNVILKSMGLDAKSTNAVTIIQITTYFLASIIFLIPLIYFLSKYHYAFREIYNTFMWQHYVLLFVINVMLGIYVAIRVNRSIRKKSIISSMMAE